MTLEKPPHGSPCNNCGLCCKEELCPLAEFVFKPRSVHSQCPALDTEDDGSYSCGLVKRPAHFSPIRAAVVGASTLTNAALVLIGSGFGCDARHNSEKENPQFLARFERFRSENYRRIMNARALWGMK